ncbi:MAG: glycine cleavage system aminomethyltransferase GcvT [Gammaproteobacteria bacterium]
MPRHTLLHARHQALGATLVDFAGWAMPLHYGSQIEEHLAVRRSAGIFDVSHMSCVDLGGAGAGELLLHLLANDVGKLRVPGQGLYTCLLNEQGGVIDDLICYMLDAGRYRLVSNAATRTRVLAWLRRHAEGRAVVVEERADLAILAVQGPASRALVALALAPGPGRQAAELQAFFACWDERVFIARTGYTGEDGYELLLPAEEAVACWDTLVQAGAKPIGLGARDTLRLEAGLNLNGADLDETTTPLECGLGWTVGWGAGQRDFVGRAALQARQRAGLRWQRIGLVLEEGGVMRAGYPLRTAQGEGRVTSGGYSPVLRVSIALARVPAAHSGAVGVIIRGREHAARVADLPFVRRAVRP